RGLAGARPPWTALRTDFQTGGVRGSFEPVGRRPEPPGVARHHPDQGQGEIPDRIEDFFLIFSGPRHESGRQSRQRAVEESDPQSTMSNIPPTWSITLKPRLSSSRLAVLDTVPVTQSSNLPLAPGAL